MTIRRLMVIVLSCPRASAAVRAAPSRTATEEPAALEDVGHLLALALAERLGDLLQRPHERHAKLREQAIVAGERLFERRVVDQTARHGAAEVGAGLLHLLPDDLPVFAQLVQRAQDRLLLPRRRLEPLEGGAQKPSAYEAARATAPGHPRPWRSTLTKPIRQTVPMMNPNIDTS
jgi:hypothetical protein